MTYEAYNTPVASLFIDGMVKFAKPANTAQNAANVQGGWRLQGKSSFSRDANALRDLMHENGLTPAQSNQRMQRYMQRRVSVNDAFDDFRREVAARQPRPTVAPAPAAAPTAAAPAPAARPITAPASVADDVGRKAVSVADDVGKGATRAASRAVATTADDAAKAVAKPKLWSRMYGAAKRNPKLALLLGGAGLIGSYIGARKLFRQKPEVERDPNLQYTDTTPRYI